MISWKYSLEKINGELELAKKKKQALTKLLDEGKVSQPTYDSFTNEIAEAIAEIEAKQNTLVEKMRTKTNELEQQMKTLEFLLVNSEIRHVSGEIEEEAYGRECNVLSLGLETTRQELNEIKDAISNLSEQSLDLPPPPPLQDEEETTLVEPDAEKRLEIVMDTETTTSIETTLEEQPTVEEEPEVSMETVSEQEENVETPVEEVEESFRSEESPLSEDAEAPEISEDAPEATLEVQEETPEEASIEEETT
ncbi:MAG: CdvA-like protein [Candidatus Bathyarchaeota archaeon]|nr:CdvA-like protein [Candidatus Bathyarchaeota archaeon]